MDDVLTVLGVLGVLAIVFVAAAVATREGPVLQSAHRDAADLALPTGPLQPEDVGALRFGLALRGYRMAEVDLALDRLATELAQRDARILALETAADGRAIVRPAAPAHPSPQEQVAADPAAPSMDGAPFALPLDPLDRPWPETFPELSPPPVSGASDGQELSAVVRRALRPPAGEPSADELATEGRSPA